MKRYFLFQEIQALVEWLTEDCEAFDVRPVMIQIGEEQWTGCFYRQIFKYQSGMDAVSRGEKKAGDKYTEEGYYLVGTLPKDYAARKEPKICFPYKNEDWYIAGYMLDKNLTNTNREYHPFGAHFLLRPWRVPSGDKIDQYEPKAYNRVPMTVQNI